jgi:hypothetical protein
LIKTGLRKPSCQLNQDQQQWVLEITVLTPQNCQVFLGRYIQRGIARKQWQLTVEQTTLTVKQ